MLKAIFLALSLAAVALPPVYAQAWQDSAGQGETTGNTSMKTGAIEAVERMRPDQSMTTVPQAPQGWVEPGFAGQTRNNGMVGGNGNQYGGDMRPLGFSYGSRSGENKMARGGSGASTSVPIIIGGYNTMVAPSNLALRTQYGGSMGGLRLPETHLDSFVHKAKQTGLVDLIYGDEGVYGPPPYDFFLEIETGINSSGLTTGHPSDAPSAWGTPLKYNSMGGVIKGEQ